MRFILYRKCFREYNHYINTLRSCHQRWLLHSSVNFNPIFPSSKEKNTQKLQGWEQKSWESSWALHDTPLHPPPGQGNNRSTVDFQVNHISPMFYHLCNADKGRTFKDQDSITWLQREDKFQWFKIYSLYTLLMKQASHWLLNNCNY